MDIIDTERFKLKTIDDRDIKRKSLFPNQNHLGFQDDIRFTDRRE